MNPKRALEAGISNISMTEHWLLILNTLAKWTISSAIVLGVVVYPYFNMMERVDSIQFMNRPQQVVQALMEVMA